MHVAWVTSRVIRVAASRVCCGTRVLRTRPSRAPIPVSVRSRLSRRRSFARCEIGISESLGYHSTSGGKRILFFVFFFFSQIFDEKCSGERARSRSPYRQIDWSRWNRPRTAGDAEGRSGGGGRTSVFNTQAHGAQDEERKIASVSGEKERAGVTEKSEG